MFKVLDEYIPKNAFSMLVLTPLRIYDYETGPKVNIIGRATGDWIAVVTLKGTHMKEIFESSAHELLHTMGVDHCIEFKCLMNAYISGGKHLCPIDMKKLENITKTSKKEWLENLVKFYDKPHWREEFNWTTNLIKQIDNYD